MSRLRVTLVRSASGHKFDQKRTVQALGLRKLGHSVEHSDTPSIRGMIFKVRHLVAVEEAER